MRNIQAITIVYQDESANYTWRVGRNGVLKIIDLSKEFPNGITRIYDIIFATKTLTIEECSVIIEEKTVEDE